MITFLIGLIVIVSILYILYQIGRITSQYVFKEPNPTFEHVFFAIALFIGCSLAITLILNVIYLVGEHVTRLFA